MAIWIFNVEDKGNYLHIWIDFNSVIPDKNGWLNLTVYKNEIKKVKRKDFMDTLDEEMKLYTNFNKKWIEK